ncbi:MAG TPA: IS110 family transposase [Pedobacter sp.]|jgi:transposase
MQNQLIAGIDISSTTLDICVSNDQGQQSFVISNDVKSIVKFFSTYKEQLIIGMENTGRYNWALYEALKKTTHRVFVVSPLHLKKSMGLVRGKDDKTDAIRIAAFIRKNHTELPEWKPSSQAVQKLKVLLTERNARIKTKKQLLKQQYDYAKMKHLGLDKSLMKLNKQHLVLIGKQIEHIEQQIEAVIRADEQLYPQVQLIRTIPGVGKVLSWMMLAKTEGFQTITEPRKMACYSGVVPFANQSGTSLKGRHRVSLYADKAIKAVLHLAAMSAIRLKNDLQHYYRRKVAEGKNKMSALNAVRNKIIHRIFAVIKKQQPYKNILLLS